MFELGPSSSERGARYSCSTTAGVLLVASAGSQRSLARIQWPPPPWPGLAAVTPLLLLPGHALLLLLGTIALPHTSPFD